MTGNQVEYSKTVGRCGVELLQDGAFFYCQDGVRIQWAHSCARSADGRRIDTRSARRVKVDCAPAQSELGTAVAVTECFEEEDLRLFRTLMMYEGAAWITVQIALEDLLGEARTSYLAPIDTPYPSADGAKLLLSLDQKMLLVPYDNDMWVRYESTPPRPGRTSYDVTAIYDEDSRNALVIGALDHLVWKNAIAWSGVDARSVTAFCGAADWATHDFVPHGCVRGPRVESSRVMMCWCDDVREGMECFADQCARVRPAMPWRGGVPFGFNTFSGMGGALTLDNWQRAGDLIHQELDSFNDADGVTYINLDAYFNQDEARIADMVRAFHARGQKAGTYAAPFIAHKRLKLDQELMGGTGCTYRDLLLKDERGRPLPAPDGLIPLDVTHPAWEAHIRALIQKVIAMGFDYLKIDFLSHGGMEGAHADRNCMTGRMALVHGYEVICDELAKSPRPIFLSLSIAPIFPHGYGHARRCCCDSFGHIEDVRYVLNALNFSWWISGRLYAYNDPDHIVLYNSVIDGRGPTRFEEARSRYNAAAISGTVMLLSDNFGPDGDAQAIACAVSRARALAQNPEINAIARRGKSFRPVELRDGTACAYVGGDAGAPCAALFNFSRSPQTVAISAARAGLPAEGVVKDLNRGVSWLYRETIAAALPPMDSAILVWQSEMPAGPCDCELHS